MTHKALIRQLQISCLGLDRIDPLCLLVDDVIAALAQTERTWVGLTDEQITQVIKSMPRGIKGWMSDWDLYEFSKAIEAKLKEKNT